MRIWKGIIILLFLCCAMSAAFAQSCLVEVTSNPSNNQVNLISLWGGNDYGDITPWTFICETPGVYALDAVAPWVWDWNTGHFVWLPWVYIHATANPEAEGWWLGNGAYCPIFDHVQMRIEGFSPSEPLMPVDNNLSVNANQAVTFTWADGLYDGDSTPGVSPDYYNLEINSTDLSYSHIFTHIHGYSLTILPTDAFHLLPNKNYTWTVKAFYNDNGASQPRTNFVMITTYSGSDLRVRHFSTVDGPLPVELSSFTATSNASNFVSLNWTTQSETNLSGYYIYKGTDNDLNNADRISTIISPTNTSQENDYIYTDDNVNAGNTYFYWLQNLDLDGETGYYGPVSVTIVNHGNEEPAPEIQNHISLLPAYPNPFGSQTILPYKLTAPGEVKIEIFNSKGQLIRSFNHSHPAAGVYRFNWNGLNNDGKPVSSGVYTYRMTSGKYIASKKVVYCQ